MLACPVKRNVPFRVVDVLLLDKMLDEHPSAQQIVHVAMCQRISLQSSTSIVGVKGGQQLDHATTDRPSMAQLPHTPTSETTPPCTSQRLARVNAIITQASADKAMVLVDELLDSLEAEKEQFNAIYYDWLASQQAGSVAESCDGSLVAQSDLRPVGVVDVGVSDTNANCSDEDYLNSDETAWELSCNGEVTSNDHCNLGEVVTRVSTNIGNQFTVVWETPSIELYPRIWSLLTMEVRSRIAGLKQELGVSSTKWESLPSNVLCPVLYDKLPPEMKAAVTRAAILAFHRFMGTETRMNRKKRKRGGHRK